VTENLGGFYELASRTVVLRREPPPLAQLLGSMAEGVLTGHEIEHALQDQSFHMERLTQIDDDDRRLAAAALFEGDAELVGRTRSFPSASAGR
jgi:hypothetical protein